jgi:hypothetical protein
MARGRSGDDPGLASIAPAITFAVSSFNLAALPRCELFEIMKPGETPVEPAPRSTVERVKDKLPFVKKKPTPGARNIR